MISEYSMANSAGTVAKTHRLIPVSSATARSRYSTAAAAINEKTKKTRDAMVAGDMLTAAESSQTQFIDPALRSPFQLLAVVTEEAAVVRPVGGGDHAPHGAHAVANLQLGRRATHVGSHPARTERHADHAACAQACTGGLDGAVQRRLAGA